MPPIFTRLMSNQAEGRDSDDSIVSRAQTWGLPRDIYVPRVSDGTLHYTLMEIVATSEPGNYWTLRLKAPQPLIPTPVTMALPTTTMRPYLGY